LRARDRVASMALAGLDPGDLDFDRGDGVGPLARLARELERLVERLARVGPLPLLDEALAECRVHARAIVVIAVQLVERRERMPRESLAFARAVACIREIRLHCFEAREPDRVVLGLSA